MFAPVIGAAYTMTTKREAHWSEQTKAQNSEKGMYVGLKQPRGDGERYVTPARAAAKETMNFRVRMLLKGAVNSINEVDFDKVLTFFNVPCNSSLYPRNITLSQIDRA